MPPKMASRKTRDSGCCSINFIKYVLYIFNIIFLFAGLLILGLGLWTVIEKHPYTALLSNDIYALVAYLLIVAGGLTVLTTTIGCCSLWRENRPLILIYIFLLLLIFLLEVMVGLLSFVYAGHIKGDLEQNLNATFLENYNFDPAKTRAIDEMQQNYKCCGANNYEDWAYSRWRKENLTKNFVPDSCCKTISANCGKRKHPSNINSNSCLEIMATEMRNHLYILSNVGLGIFIIPVFGLVLSCCLFLKLRNILD